MKKDGLTAAIRASHLRVVEEESSIKTSKDAFALSATCVESSVPRDEHEEDETEANAPVKDDNGTYPSELRKPPTKDCSAQQVFIIGDTRNTSATETTTIAPKGVPKSGRIWKRLKTQKFSAMKVDRPIRTSWQEKNEKRAELRATKGFAKELHEERSARAKEVREKTEERKRRKLENQRKSEIVQPIKNTAKIKRMRRKQLRSIETR